MTHASVFSGIGGFDLAAKWAGFTNVFNCEIESFCRTILNYYFPNAKQYSDIRTTDFTPWRGKVDILTGGFPCQPFSVAGDRRGAQDDRYLWPEMLRAIREIRPTWIVGENVGGIVSMVQPGEEVDVESQASLFEENYTETIHRQEFVIETICRDLENIGYSVQPLVIPACAVEAPHRRDRIWLIAHSECIGRNEVEFHNGELKKSQQAECGQVKFSGAYSPQSWWREFPTQSPVCCGDDGVSCQLDDLAISSNKWREKSISGYGNTVVPLVPLQIFKAISKIYTVKS